ncbi:hypothetical protein Rsub_02051 [Raphidocelis subcapitata]|uniref:Uncharacterized protein n=1 Tax=Raphidocelis subcapitata TaxID=307507 RepID=A0A2V0NQC1_9CHLO|nr:hypothetical protein Rsub_02051 [Raphidocelis subcapitata]|eukprot:GBF89479.1 hypothetical protein Rsub_02051 [Raphidocelis subcapitata]
MQAVRVRCCMARAPGAAAAHVRPQRLRGGGAARPLEATASFDHPTINALAVSLVHGVQRELVAESVLHTPIGTPLTCIRSNELPVAPPLAADGADVRLLDDAALASEAACLATPAEPVEREAERVSAARATLARLRAPAEASAGGGPLSPHAAAAGQRPAAGMGAVGGPPRLAPALGEGAAEDSILYQLEVWQRRMALLECGELAAEYAKRSAPVRRRRRRAVVRALREARTLLRTVSPGATPPATPASSHDDGDVPDATKAASTESP